MLKIKLLFVAFLLTGQIFGQSKEKSSLKYADGRELITAMFNAYAPDKWYRYFTFSQTLEFYRNDSIIKRDVWHEAYQPGALIIKIGSKDSKSGRMYTNFTMYSFEDGKEIQRNPRVHDLLVVGLDVYFVQPQRTVQILDSLGYDLSKIREDKFMGRKVYVVGADKGDEKSNQFWIDADRLYMHRIITGRKGKVSDVLFGDYKKMKGKWIAKTIIFKTDGKLSLIERYYDIKFPETINADWFKPEKFNEVNLD